MIPLSDTLPAMKTFIHQHPHSVSVLWDCLLVQHHLQILLFLHSSLVEHRMVPAWIPETMDPAFIGLFFHPKESQRPQIAPIRSGSALFSSPVLQYSTMAHIHPVSCLIASCSGLPHVLAYSFEQCQSRVAFFVRHFLIIPSQEFRCTKHAINPFSSLLDSSSSVPVGLYPRSIWRTRTFKLFLTTLVV